MKTKITLLLVVCLTFGFAQQNVLPPAGYYNTATGSGYTLKTQLFNIISANTIDRGYSGLYTTYLTSDRDYYYENDGSLLDMYTENPTGPECFFTYGTNQDDGSGGTAECEKYNREHIIPQSVFQSNAPMHADAHFVVPADKYVNAQRGNFPIGKVGTASNTYTNGSKRGNGLNSGYAAGYSGTVFEPIDEFKGDVARMYFYFITRYENQVAGWSYSMFNGTSNQVLTNTFLNVLITWHLQDPVSQREKDRNDAIYARQNNRNPYIDNPNYVCQIFPSQCTALTSESFLASDTIAIYPNPSNDGNFTIETKLSLNSYQIFNMNGQLITDETVENISNAQNFSINNLATGFYIIKLNAMEGSLYKKIIAN